MTSGRCIVANEISSSKYAGSIKGQQPVKWHCSSECGEHCRLFHWFLGQCFLLEVHPFMTGFCTFWKVLFQ